MTTPGNRAAERFLNQYGNAQEVGELDRYLRNLFYGLNNAGKTVLASSIGERPLLFACDENYRVIENFPELKKKVLIVKHRKGNTDQYGEVIEAIANGWGNYGEVDHFITDTYPQLVEDFLDVVAQNSTVKFGSSGRNEWTFQNGFKLNGRTTVNLTGPADFNLVRSFFRPFIDKLTELPIHVSFLAHETKYQNFVSGETAPVRANLPDQTYLSLARRCQNIGHVQAISERGNIKRTISFEATNSQEAGAKVAGLEGRTLTTTKFIELINNWIHENQ